MPPDRSQKPLRTFAAVHKTDSDKNACLSDRAVSIGIFMLGRSFKSYQLYVNGREYDWDKSNDIQVQEQHMIHCLDLDRAFYFPDEVSLDKPTPI